MRKDIGILLLTFCYLLNSVYAQKASITNIVTRPAPKLSTYSGDSIIYPIVHAGNSTASYKINQTIRQEVLDEDEKMALKKALQQAGHEWLVTLDYSVTYNNRGLLSMTLSMEGMGAYPTTSYFYLNFDLSTGAQIKGADLIKPDKLDSFKRMILADKRDSLNAYLKEEQKELQKKEIDSSDWESINDIVQTYCLDKINIDQFIISKDFLEIVDDCEFPHVMQGMAPSYHLRYKMKRMENWLNPYIRKKLK